MKEPKLSIITVNLNNASGLRKTIESVVNQTFRDFEYLVIDGGSTDGSVEVIKEFTDKITYWVSEPDKGIYNAMNKGILQAKGEYLQFLNSGDWLVDREVIKNVFTGYNDADILYGDIILWYDDNKLKFRSLENIKIDLGFFIESSLPHPASFIKRRLFGQELYDENLRIVSDTKFFVKQIVLNNCTLTYLKFPVVYYNMYGISENPAMQNLRKEERKLFFNALFPPLVLSSIHEFHDLKNDMYIKQVQEIKKYSGFSKMIFLTNRMALALVKRARLLFYKT